MKRSQAVTALAMKQLQELSEEERAEQLEVMTLEDWSEADDWQSLHQEVKYELESGELLEPPSSDRYNPVLLMWLKSMLLGVPNNHLIDALDDLDIKSIEGKPIELMSCPCCGNRTISERGHYDICQVCWWEDDGQDNEQADTIFGGPNESMSLTQARYNFIKFGLYNPERTDLMKLKEPMSKYDTGRIFEIISDNNGEYVVERTAGWKSKVINFTQ